MTLSKFFADNIRGCLNDNALMARGDWHIGDGNDPFKYTVKVKVRQGRTQFQVKEGRNIVARFELVMVEV